MCGALSKSSGSPGRVTAQSHPTVRHALDQWESFDSVPGCAVLSAQDDAVGEAI